MTKKFLALLSLLVSTFPFSLNAQMLEQVDMSFSQNPANTYLTGLNNTGFVTGYYNVGSGNIGFIITDRGTTLEIEPNDLPGTYTDVKVESINDYGCAVITANNGSAVTILRAYVDTVGDSISSYVIVQGLTQPTSVAFDINNNNDISGWFQSSTRFLWVKHDSIVPTGNSAYESDRYDIPSPFNTMAGGINDANKVAGFYIDGSDINPFVYDNLSHTFNILNTGFRMRLWDINNNNWVAGEFRQTTNNVYMGFIANVGTGSITQMTSLASIFQNNSIQSVANAINDNGEVAGSFLNPNTGNWTGFIYHPNLPEYRIPGFNFATDTWKMENTDGGSNPVWTPGYWAGTDYMTSDPYANNGLPVVDSFIIATQQLNTPGSLPPPDMNPKWVNFATELDIDHMGLSSDPSDQIKYRKFVKPVLFSTWRGFCTDNGVLGGFLGDCYGFTYATLLRHFFDNEFSSWYGLPSGMNISQVTNSNYDAIDAIERLLSKQFDATNIALTQQNVSFWAGTNRLKSTFRKSFSDSDPRGISITWAGAGSSHSILPYKITTPRVLPFTTEKDTLWLYDSNYPDSTAFIAIENDEVFASQSAVASSHYTQLTSLKFTDVGIRFIAGEQFSELKSTSSLDYSPYTIIGLHRASDYSMRHNGNLAAEYLNGTYVRDSTLVTAITRYNPSNAPYVHTVDSGKVFDIVTNNYTDQAMLWTQDNGPRSMGLSREAQLSETDHSSQKTGMITYGNPDNNTKMLTGYMIERSDDFQQASSIMVKNICAEAGDSIVTRSPGTFMYQVSKIVGNSTCIYELTVSAAYGDTVKEFTSEVELSGTTTHIIDPYFQGTNGTQIAVIVDNGNDGTADDTLFVTGWPVGLHGSLEKGSIRLYPNPVRDELSIEFAEAGNYKIVLSDVVGRVVYQQQLNASAGKITLPMGQYPAGVYLIQVRDAKGATLVKDKILKQ